MLLCSEMPLVWERPEIVKQKAGGWKDWSLAIFFLNYEAIPIWVFPKIGVPQNGWFIMEHPIKIDVFGGIIIFGNTHIYIYNIQGVGFKFQTSFIFTSTWGDDPI